MVVYHFWYDMTDSKKITVVFFQQDSGNEPVREWLQGLGDEDRKIIGTDIAIVEFGWPVGMPGCRAMGAGLYEVRSNLKDRIARVLFFIADGNAILLHGFIKKSQATPKTDLTIARQRMAQLTTALQKPKKSTKQKSPRKGKR